MVERRRQEETDRFPVLRGYAAHASVLWRACAGWSSVAAACSVISAIVAVGTIWSIGRLIGGLSSTVAASTSQSAGGAQGVWPWFVVVAGLLVTGQAVGGLSQLAQAQVSARYHEYVLDLVAETTMRPQGVAWLENPESAGRMRRLVEDVRHWLFRTGVDGTWQVLSVKLTGIGALVIASTWRWWAALVVALAFVLVGRAYVRWISRVYVPPGSEVLLSGRRASYLRAVVTGGRDAKEVRLFGLTDFFVERFREAALMADRLTAQSWRGASRPVVAASAVMVVILGGALVLLARDSMAGAVSVGSALAVLQALLAMSAFGPVDDAQTGLTKVATTMRHLEQVRASVALPAREALEASDTPRPRVPNGPSADGTGGRPGGGERRQPAEIVFDRVSFTYPARADPTLRRLSLRIPCGQSVAVVGVNGAGKSTLMKLLAGLYLPTEGRVLVDGQDAVKAQDERRVAVIFQDFVHYPLTLRDNVAYGSLPLLDDEARLDCVLDRAGATSLMSRLGHGWDTVLSPEFEDGTDLSGGQWQRVALARALAAVEGGAGVLVLDEPTAALDVRAEAALFDRFLSVAEGVTTVLVSHRLSSVRHAERIVVLDAQVGAIVEDGTHDDLMARGGRYAAMFTLQASRSARTGSRNAEKSEAGGAMPGTPTEPHDDAGTGR